MPDVLMLPLEAAAAILAGAGVNYCVAETRPCANKFVLIGDCRYVVRQTLFEGECHLVVAAKMGKEV